MTPAFAHIRLITFDLDDTLWPCHDVIRAAELACYDWLARQAPRITEQYDLDGLRAHRFSVSRDHPEIAHDFTQLRLRSLQLLVEAFGYPEHLAQEASDVFRTARNRVTPFDDVADSLRRLRETYILVSVTNGNSQIEKTPLSSHFDHSLTAAEVGAAKPDPAIFHAASERSGQPLSAFLHVGDDPVRDIEAARAIGVNTVWVNRYDMNWPTELAPPDLAVTDVAALADSLLG